MRIIHQVVAIFIFLVILLGSSFDSSHGQEDDSQPSSESKNFTGQWNTNWGPLELVQRGSTVTGTYVHDQGRVRGQVSADGKTVRLTWSESPSYQPPEDGGTAELQLSDDGNSFSGRWGYGDSLEQGAWTGNRVKTIQTASGD